MFAERAISSGNGGQISQFRLEQLKVSFYIVRIFVGCCGCMTDQALLVVSHHRFETKSETTVWNCEGFSDDKK